MEQQGGFLAELRRRKVLRAGLVYCAAAFALLEFADIAFPRIGLSDRAVDLVLWAGLLGLPLVLALAWALELRADSGSEHAAWLSARSVAAALALVGLGLAVGWWWGGSTGSESAASRPAARGASIAVLAFEDLHAAEGSSYFSRGLTDDISSALARFRDLTVLSPRSTADADDPDADPVRRGRKLGVRYVLSGGVRREADAVRVSAELIDVKSAAQLWSERYDRDLTTAELFAVQDDIAERVVATLADPAGVIAREELRRARRGAPFTLEAYDCVLRAYRYFQVHTTEVHAVARDCLERAVATEPDYADAWAHLAYLYREEFHHRRNPRSGSLDRALEAAKRAIALDDTNPMAHYAQAMTYFSRREFDAALAAARRTIALNPNESTIVATMGGHIAYAGHWEEGMAVIRRAAALNPHHPTFVHEFFAADDYRRGDYAAALANLMKSTRRDFIRQVVLAATYGRLGRLDEGRRLLEELRASHPEFAADPIEELRRVFFSDEAVHRYAEGLRLAGLDID